ncbi:Crp/Fnr family transcriptional regulator [Corynebacterium sp. Sa1YVA5]|uniref:Crp/Fnr family transcriptional regulator n=1 Tax=Corynebacterium gallinarum TaxID=2762214 RepID=A0A8I0HGH1_9CORY|nr:Crp/Fnr family transcriptional regulator [Corynebacterium gallinarum]MBD8031376.1 Crp/Fnr family transcriptional regulator [Corynebacterium gallinarum]
MKRSRLARGLSEEQMVSLASGLDAWSWHEGDPLLLAGEEADGSYMIASGRARITRDTIDGRELTLDIAAPGDIVGPVSTEPTPAVDSAWAMETTCALFIPATALAEVVSTYPEFALEILQMQQERLRQAREREVGQTVHPVQQRVAAVLEDLAEKIGQRLSDGSVLLQVRLRRQDIAGMAGTTVESTSRVMSKMKKDGVIDSGREWVSILDSDALSDLAAGE